MSYAFRTLVTFLIVFAGAGLSGGAWAQTHAADQNADLKISLSELLRVIQFFNSGGFGCAEPPESTEDGYLPGAGGTQTCDPHDSDYNPGNWAINLSELLRLIQIYNSASYEACEGTEDGFCPIRSIGEGEGEGEGEGGFEGEGEGGFGGEGEGAFIDTSILVDIVDVEVIPGEFVFIPVNLNVFANKPATMSFIVNYSTFRLTYNGAAQGNIVGGASKTFESTDLGEGQVLIEITDPDMNGIGMKSGGLMTLAFTVSPDAEFGQLFTVFGSEAVSADIFDNPLNITVAAGVIRIDSDTPIAPVVDFDPDSEIGLPGSAIRFADDTSLGTGDNPVYAWDFGDGAQSAERSPVHVFESIGEYDVSLTVTTSDGSDTETKTDLIEIIAGDRFYVNKSNTKGVNDGTSWASAFVTIQEGIDAAADADGGEVWVAANVYNESRPNATGSLMMKPVVNVYGGFSGVEVAVGQRNPTLNVTTIDGSIARGGAPARHVVIGAETTRLDGFTVTGGRATAENGTGANQGAGLVTSGVSPLIVNCRFEDNEAGSVGGAISIDNGAPAIIDCIFTGNRVANTGNPDSFAFGGAIFTSLGSSTIEGCVFTSNTVTSSAEWPGGAVNRLSQAYGGAIYMNGGATTLLRCTFGNNIASATGVGFGTQELSEYGARPRALGGAIYTNGGTVIIDRCTVSANNASTNQNGAFARACGGGIYNESTRLTVKNTNIYNNLTQDFANGFTGTGICNDNTALTRPVIITNCTIVNNTSSTLDPARAGGILNVMANATITNCIVRDNTGGSIVNSSATPNVTFSNVGGGFLGEGNFDLNPLFVSPGAGNYHLSAGSSCIDSGRDTSGIVYGSVIADIDGDSRGRDGTVIETGDGSDYDVGADEF